MQLLCIRHQMFFECILLWFKKNGLRDVRCTRDWDLIQFNSEKGNTKVNNTKRVYGPGSVVLDFLSVGPALYGEEFGLRYSHSLPVRCSGNVFLFSFRHLHIFLIRYFGSSNTTLTPWRKTVACSLLILGLRMFSNTWKVFYYSVLFIQFVISELIIN